LIDSNRSLVLLHDKCLIFGLLRCVCRQNISDT
jgi:hypothetical protein